MVTQKFIYDLKQGNEEERRHIISQSSLPLDPEIVLILIDSLSDPSSAVCEAVVDVLGYCTKPICMEMIVARLNSPNPIERNYILEIICKIGDLAIPFITSYLDHPDRNVRKQAIDALVVVATEHAFIPLKHALMDPDPIVASSAAEALGQLGFKQAVPFLEEALKTDNQWMQAAILTSLGNIGGIDALRIICSLPDDLPDTVMATLLQAIESAAEADPDLAINCLITFLKKDSHPFEGYILCVLEPLLQKNNHLSTGQLLPVLKSATKSLNSTNPSICASAIKCFALISIFLPGELTRFAQMPNFLIRKAALQAMVMTKDIDISLAASIAFDSRVLDELRIQALDALANTSNLDNSIEAQLITMINQNDIKLRIPAINVLLRWNNEKGIISIIDFFEDIDNWDEENFISEFRLFSNDLLVKIIEIGFKKLEDQARYHMFHAMFPLEWKSEWVIGSQIEYNIILNALRDPYWTIRVHAVRLYGERFLENEHILVLMATQDPDERVRGTAINILNHEKKLNQELALLLLHDNSPRIHRAVLMIILEMDPDQISPPVINELLIIINSISQNEEFTILYHDIKRKFLNEGI